MHERDYLEQLRALQRQAWPAGHPTDPQYPLGQRPLTEYLRHWATTTPDKPAVRFYGHDLSYAELNELSDRFAALLLDQGVQAGDRIAVFLPNCPQLHIVFYGILKAGAVHAPVSPMATATELAYQLKDCGASVMVCFDQLLPVVRAASDQTALRVLISTSLAEVCPAEPPFAVPELLQAPKLDVSDSIDLLPALAATEPRPDLPPPALDAMAALNYTGGTTGLPKGCIHTHGDMLYTCASFMPAALGLDSERVSLNFMPEFWIAGENAGLLFPVFGGTTLVLLARWDALAFMGAVQHYRVNHTGLLVDSAAEILDHAQRDSFDLSSLQVTSCVSFIKKLTPEYRRRWRELTGCTLFETSFGMTETHTCDTFTAGLQNDDFDLKSAPTFVGLPVPGTEFKVCDFDTGALLPLGSEGELCVRSPSLLKGYWNRPQASAEALRDGWLHTGDNGVITEQGFIRYLGRRKEMLKVNGMSVFPAELEAMLGQHPDLLASAVVGRPDAQRGEVPVAFVIAKPGSGLDAEQLTAWCRQAMSGYKVPEVRLVESLPMTATGKVKKNELKDWI
ncbi:acyl-CoA synthetase [Pseudomonas saudimassiliensis]|uniref:Acyl-CoA synthetase n=1 Tax=Pseudomonas saudimassiliensis TaxID=1461581 RepID=A0A078MGM8_9PSED|nr:AMP-binding protein [Pseudomonas saudimassiliensis]CEA03811.1 acyl-CoA synthetase [Pseudomonas saudimassiliensis]CEF26313.1 acyl-CoA synthetase [Pseudomonas saudimassiliensis]